MNLAKYIKATISNGEARSQVLGDNASLTDKASTREGTTVAQERHNNDISCEL